LDLNIGSTITQKFSDEELAKKIADLKDADAFEKLYSRYDKKVYNKCFGFVKNEDEAKDLTQEVFLKLFTTIGSFKGTAKFSTWLYSLTYNYCVNYINRDKEAKINRNSVDIDSYLEEIDEVDDSELYALKVENLEKSLNLIQPEEKIILLLKYQDDASIKDLQAIYGIGQSAVKMRLNRAKINLLNTYNKIQYEP